MSEHVDQGCLIVTGPERPGLVAAISSVIAEQGGNIVANAQFSSTVGSPTFFQRTVFDLPHLAEALPGLEDALTRKLEPLGQAFRLVDRSVRKRMVILASRSDHCLLELLWRQRRGELEADIPLVISNHTDVQEQVEFFGLRFEHVPSAGPDKSEAEARILELAREVDADVVVLARYMQIISDEFLQALAVPVINIHHSFLPAFIGAAPYRKAWERGVKLIGATAHYVTAELDAGPIIEQDVARVDHTQTAADLQQRGAYVERAVLSRAVQAHLEDRVIRHGNHTVVFP